MTELPLPREAYDMWGSAPLRYVLVHGVGGDRTQWRALAEHLAMRAGVLAIDLAGHGAARHVGGPYRVSRFAAGVAEIAYRRAHLLASGAWDESVVLTVPAVDRRSSAGRVDNVTSSAQR